MKNEKIIEVLNDLMKIHQDRMEGYENAAETTENLDDAIKTMLFDKSEKSEALKRDLSKKALEFGSVLSQDVVPTGKIYRSWIQIDAAFTGHDTFSILAACEYGEDATQYAYRAALKMGSEFPADVRQLIITQQSSLKLDHDEIKSERDAYKNKMVSH
jgi:uncharacterized protein (TIGR02284 family)